MIYPGAQAGKRGDGQGLRRLEGRELSSGVKSSGSGVRQRFVVWGKSFRL